MLAVTLVILVLAMATLLPIGLHSLDHAASRLSLPSVRR